MSNGGANGGQAPPASDLNTLRADAVKIIDEEQATQRARWRELNETVRLAGVAVSNLRHEAQENPGDDGYPLWFSALITVAIGLLPIGMMTNLLLSNLVTFGRYALGRIGVDKTANAVRKLYIQNPQLKGWTPDAKGIGTLDASTQMTDLLVKNDKITKGIVEVFGGEMNAAMRSLVRKATEAKPQPLYAADKDSGKFVRLRKSESGSVVVMRALHDWMNWTEQAEDKAVAELRHWVSTANLNQDSLKELGEKLKKNLAAPVYEGPDDRVMFQRLIEAAIWCTTYDFTPRRATYTDYELSWPFPILVEKSKLVPIPLKKELWSRLTEHFIDPDEGKTYKEVGPHPRFGTVADPVVTPQPGRLHSPEIRLSVFFSLVLRRKIMNAQKDIMDAIVLGRVREVPEALPDKIAVPGARPAPRPVPTTGGSSKANRTELERFYDAIYSLKSLD